MMLKKLEPKRRNERKENNEIYNVAFRNSFFMLIGLQLIVFIDRFFSTGEIDQFELFTNKDYLILSLRIWGALFITYFCGYFIVGEKTK